MPSDMQAPAQFTSALNTVRPTNNHVPVSSAILLARDVDPRQYAQIWRGVGHVGSHSMWLGNSTRWTRHGELVDVARYDAQAWFGPPTPHIHQTRPSRNIWMIFTIDTAIDTVIEFGHTHRYDVARLTNTAEQHTCNLCGHSFVVDHGD